MSTATIETVTRMLESLPDAAQAQAVEYLREYLDEVTEEMRWDESFARTSEKVGEAARELRQQFKEGKTEPVDIERL